MLAWKRSPCCWKRTYWLECSDFRGLCEVVQTILHVVDGCAAVDTVEAGVGDLWDTFVGSILGLEVTNMISDYWNICVCPLMVTYRIAVQ
jgi:hypothetical protein